MIDHLQESRMPQAPLRRPAFSPQRASADAESAPGSRDARPAAESTLARKACVVAFRSGEAVHRHPDLKSYLDDGWFIESAVPQLTDAQNVELLVVLSRCADLAKAMAEDDAY